MSPSAILLLLALFSLVSSSVSTHPFVFHVGEDEGWVPTPKESYDHWSQRNRFEVNDKLVFKYKKDAVLEVTEDKYNTCNRSAPLRRMTSGNSVIVLDRPGPIFFISGRRGHCQKGQKLKVVVMSEGKRDAPTPSPASSPEPSPPSKSPATAPAPAPASSGSSSMRASVVALVALGVGAVGALLC